jgi:DNA-binding CsgD family transcriptional regulator
MYTNKSGRTLNKKQIRVFDKLVQNKTYEISAKELFISRGGFVYHVRNIYKHFGFNSQHDVLAHYEKNKPNLREFEVWCVGNLEIETDQLVFLIKIIKEYKTVKWRNSNGQ